MSESTFELLDPDAVLPILPEIAVCPYCDTKLSAQFDSWEQQDDGTWAADRADLDCETEPDIDSDEWVDWFESHSDMPYVYMLPVETKVLDWINAHYRFRMEG